MKLFSPDFVNYRNFSFNFSSLPQEQDWLALFSLKSMGKISEDSIIVTGYTGDLLAGSYHFSSGEIKPNSNFRPWLINRITEEFFGWRFRLSKSELNDIFDILDSTIPFDINSLEQLEDCWINWFTENVVGSFVVNGNRAFEHLGFEWKMPLWDREWTDLWYSISRDEKRERKLYRKALNARFFKKHGIETDRLSAGERIRSSTILNTIRKNTPAALKKMGKSLLTSSKDHDVNQLSILEGLLEEKLSGSLRNKVKQGDHRINLLHAIYTLEELGFSNPG
jgi:hypothetical protein